MPPLRGSHKTPPWPCESSGYSGRVRRRQWTLTLIPVGLALIGGLAIALFFLLDGDSSPRTPEPLAPTPTTTDAGTPAPTATPTPVATSTPTPTTAPSPTDTPAPSPTPTASATATPTATATEGASPTTVAASPDEPRADGRPSRCASVAGRGAQLITAVEDAMVEYEGVWGLALIDLDCGSSIVVRPQHSQYPASAGKIVILTAALRAVQDGLLEFAAIEEHLDLVLYYSLDKNTDEVAALVTPEQVGAVMGQAGVSAGSYLEWQWRQAWFTPHDLALVWASILRGEQLDERWTAYLLQLASEVILPEGKEAFPADFGLDGYQYGQKAGYWVNEEEPDHFVAAGYVRPEDGVSAGFTFAFLLKTWEDDISEPQRRAVFPLVRDFVVGEVERNR